MKDFYGFTDRPDGVAQVAVLLDAGTHQDRGWLCGDETFLCERINVSHDRVLCAANCVADRSVARPARGGAAVFKATKIGIHCDLACIQSE